MEPGSSTEVQAWHAQPALQGFSEAAGAFFQAFGFKRNVGRLWAVLYLAPGPLDQAELAEILDLSAGLISMGLRELEGLGAVRAEVVPGHRRVRYSAEPRLLRVVAAILTRRDLEAVLAFRAGAQAARAALPAGGASALARERLVLVDDVTHLYEALATLVVRLSHARVPALGPVLDRLRARLPGFLSS